VCAGLAVLVFLIWLILNPVLAKNAGQWSLVDPEVRSWYESLKQPDTGISCCGEADSYFCDEHAEGNQVYCIIDDDRNDTDLKRHHIDNGTRIDIPTNKLNHDANLVGHGVVFLSGSNYVWCFVGIGGV
jgi:hypothetical protein